MGIYLRPTGIEEALAALAGGGLTILAGGTDFYPARVGRPLDDDIIDLTAVAALRGISESTGEFRIGAATTWSDIVRAELPPLLRALQLAGREIGGVQIQNTGTIAGNLCNASPAADGVPCLLALDAIVDLASQRGTRSLGVADFVTGNRQTARQEGEMVTAIRIPKSAREARATFLKLGARRYLVISIAMVSAVVERTANGTIAAARIAVGACSAVARRLPALEAELEGKRLAPGIGALVAAAHLADLTPIDDVRGTASYRRDAACKLVARALEELAA